MFVVNLSLLMCKRRVRKVSMFKMCFLLREELLDILTLVIVLRQANVSLPPVIGHVKSLCFLTELHEIFAGCDCCDPGLRMTQEILFTSHMLTSLLQGLGPLRDAWKRYLRKHFVLPTSYQNIADNLTRRALRKGFHSDIRSMSFKSFHEAWDPDEESWMMSQVIALHENSGWARRTSIERVPFLQRKWHLERNMCLWSKMTSMEVNHCPMMSLIRFIHCWRRISTAPPAEVWLSTHGWAAFPTLSELVLGSSLGAHFCPSPLFLVHL